MEVLPRSGCTGKEPISSIASKVGPERIFRAVSAKRSPAREKRDNTSGNSFGSDGSGFGWPPVSSSSASSAFLLAVCGVLLLSLFFFARKAVVASEREIVWLNGNGHCIEMFHLIVLVAAIVHVLRWAAETAIVASIWDSLKQACEGLRKKNKAFQALLDPAKENCKLADSIARLLVPLTLAKQYKWSLAE